MSFILTVRLSSKELADCDSRAACMGLNRTDFIKHLIRSEPPQSAKKRKRAFVSSDLIGKYSIGSGSSNSAVRKALASRAREKSR